MAEWAFYGVAAVAESSTKIGDLRFEFLLFCRLCRFNISAVNVSAIELDAASFNECQSALSAVGTDLIRLDDVESLNSYSGAVTVSSSDWLIISGSKFENDSRTESGGSISVTDS